MRVLAVIAAALGCLLVAVGGFALHTTLTAWDILGGSGALMGLQPDHWRGHWLGTAVVYIILGLAFLGFATPLWRRSLRAAMSWCIVVSFAAALSVLLFVVQPLPYGFQQTSVGEVVFLIALSLLSWFIIRAQRHHAKAI
jgi:hypothetical protein